VKLGGGKGRFACQRQAKRKEKDKGDEPTPRIVGGGLGTSIFVWSQRCIGFEKKKTRLCQSEIGRRTEKKESASQGSLKNPVTSSQREGLTLEAVKT